MSSILEYFEDSSSSDDSNDDLFEDVTWSLGGDSIDDSSL
jgi:hypothetical protein